MRAIPASAPTPGTTPRGEPAFAPVNLSGLRLCREAISWLQGPAIRGRDSWEEITVAVDARILFALASITLLLPCGALAQAPKANGETLNIQNYAGTTGNMHAVVAKARGLCTKYNFTCELKTLNSGTLGLQALVGKTIDVSLTGTLLAAQTVAAGGEVVIVGTSLPNNVLAVSVRNDVPLPNKSNGYPAIMKDFKGLKVGETARGAGEALFNHMLRE